MHTRGDYRLSCDPASVDVARVHRWLADESYWATGRPLNMLRRALAGSRTYCVLDPAGEQVGFGRAVTDGATFAWICDVFIDAGHRGRGLGTWLAETIVRDLEELGVQRLMLATRDAHDVYRQAGFRALAEPGRWMEIDRRPPGSAVT